MVPHGEPPAVRDVTGEQVTLIEPALPLARRREWDRHDGRSFTLHVSGKRERGHAPGHALGDATPSAVFEGMHNGTACAAIHATDGSDRAYGWRQTHTPSTLGQCTQRSSARVATAVTPRRRKCRAA